MWQMLVGPVANVVDTVLKRVLPAEKMSEEERLRLQNEIQLEVMKADWSKIEAEFRDRADARALAKADVEHGNWFSNILAATVRPAWAYWCMGVVTVLVLGNTTKLIDPSADIIDLVKTIVSSILLFYFGGRSAEKIATLFVNRGK